MGRGILASVIFAAAVSARAQSITEIPLSDPHSGLGRIVRGPDGNLWFTERQPNKIGTLPSSGGTVTEFAAAAVTDGGLTLRTQSISPGPDGNVWYLGTEAGSGYVGKITTAGVATAVSAVIRNRLYSITTGPDGNLWFTGATNNVMTVRKITTGGVVTEYPIPTPNGSLSTASGITTGPDGNLWFTEQGGDKIGRITTSGSLAEFALAAHSAPSGIAVGPDGALWFTESGTGRIGRMTTDGTLTNEFDLPTASSSPQDITAAADGNLWFTESAQAANRIGRITTSGQVTEDPVPTASSAPFGIAYAGGSIWFTEGGAGKIGQIAGVGPGPCVVGPNTLCLNGGRFKVQVAWSVPDQGKSGSGMAVPLTGDTGYFWFFSASNIELVIKVLDASVINHHFWVFYGALSDVAYTITVTDTATNIVKQYENPYHHLASFADTSAFQSSTVASELAMDGPALAATDVEALSASELYALYGALTQAAAAQKAAAAGCAADGQTLCLNGGRFQVKVSWSAPSQGKSGEGQAVPITGDTGYFWFFSDNNVELIIKVLDGRGINGHYWVFYGALSNVQYTITVTDTQTTAHRVYENPDGTQASSADTSAF